MTNRNFNRLKFKQKKNNLGADHLTSEGVGDFRKKILQTDSKEIPAIQWLCVSGGKIITRGLGKKFLPKLNHPYAPLKVK